jgi:hypothetical protein
MIGKIFATSLFAVIGPMLFRGERFAGADKFVQGRYRIESAGRPGIRQLLCDKIDLSLPPNKERKNPHPVRNIEATRTSGIQLIDFTKSPSGNQVHILPEIHADRNVGNS